MSQHDLASFRELPFGELEKRANLHGRVTKVVLFERVVETARAHGTKNGASSSDVLVSVALNDSQEESDRVGMAVGRDGFVVKNALKVHKSSVYIRSEWVRERFHCEGEDYAKGKRIDSAPR